MPEMEERDPGRFVYIEMFPEPGHRLDKTLMTAKLQVNLVDMVFLFLQMELFLQ